MTPTHHAVGNHRGVEVGIPFDRAASASRSSQLTIPFYNVAQIVGIHGGRSVLLQRKDVRGLIGLRRVNAGRIDGDIEVLAVDLGTQRVEQGRYVVGRGRGDEPKFPLIAVA